LDTIASTASDKIPTGRLVPPPLPPPSLLSIGLSVRVVPPMPVLSNTDNRPSIATTTAATDDNAVMNTAGAAAVGPSQTRITGHWRYACTECGQSFRQRHSLDKHRLKVGCTSMGAEAPPYRCLEYGCDQWFYTESQLNSHCHTPLANPCRECNKYFIKPEHLLLHNHNCHGVPLPYPCDYDSCDRQYATRERLVLHKFNCNHITTNDGVLQPNNTPIAAAAQPLPHLPVLTCGFSDPVVPPMPSLSDLSLFSANNPHHRPSIATTTAATDDNAVVVNTADATAEPSQAANTGHWRYACADCGKSFRRGKCFKNHRRRAGCTAPRAPTPPYQCLEYGCDQ
ncbi:unnamed protein product, partial [Medioppia subpectinata]